jgi:octaprenyl-diphosphate synthase
MVRLDVSSLYSPAAAKLEAVEGELRRIVSSDVPLVRSLAEHVSRGSGKRLRPGLVLTSSRLSGCTSDEDVRFAAVFELIHTATLIHDDVIDHSPTRRGRPSLNAAWGNTLSVLFGDFLYLQAVGSALAGRSWRMMEILASVATRMVEGELMQNECLYSLDTSRDAYFAILERKTALLFAACAECGGVLAGRDEAFCRRLNGFGLELGRAFQLVDDLLDYTATGDQMGKPVFSDLREGKLTLPMLALLERDAGASAASAASVASIVRRAWEGGQAIPDDDARELLALLERRGCFDETRELAAKASRAAVASLPDDGDPDILGLLKGIPDMLLERTC